MPQRIGMQATCDHFPFCICFHSQSLLLLHRNIGTPPLSISMCTCSAELMDAEPDADLFISTDCISHEVSSTHLTCCASAFFMRFKGDGPGQGRHTRAPAGSIPIYGRPK